MFPFQAKRQAQRILVVDDDELMARIKASLRLKDSISSPQ